MINVEQCLTLHLLGKVKYFHRICIEIFEFEDFPNFRHFRASPADMAAAARGNEPDEKNIMDGGEEWQSHP